MNIRRLEEVSEIIVLLAAGIVRGRSHQHYPLGEYNP